MSCMCLHDVDCTLVREVKALEHERDAALTALLAETTDVVLHSRVVQRERDEARAEAARLAAALQGVIRVADRKTIEFDAARVALAAAPQARELREALRAAMVALHCYDNEACVRWNDGLRTCENVGAEDPCRLCQTHKALAHPALKEWS